MKLRGIEFGRVTGASGVQGFFGEGYWFHHLPGGPSFRGMTLVAKTTTLDRNEGNLPLTADYRPKELLPKCIRVNRRQEVALNAVGLSGPGAEPLFATGRWQALAKPFMLSFMSIAPTAAERMRELREYVRILERYRPFFRAPFALQINFSCVNTTYHPEDVVGESEEALGIAAALGIPLIPKYNTDLPAGAALRISWHPACDALCVSNTIKWSEIPERERLRMFGATVSPLASMGGGGISGRYLFPQLIRWLQAARQAGLQKPLNAGGGILSLADARLVLKNAPDNSSVFLGSVAFLHPWRVQGIIDGLNSER